ncbi:hypothetical protein SAMN04488542_10555 [Fontibacillus panacisegetis]|uniref:HTH cro/C1-type domain-containing protein n=1 Tax=Fontibacillus panacisegetis TaxID=670482 RepID=A0A1G7HW26_9BACL|nr:helix-turn-helix transcriptional regulator [Fontibacillus panacisegetis]SDF04558.1 hypothetical protein SAMN04488542_10555 [Fontibacillus panacisegetis]
MQKQGLSLKQARVNLGYSIEQVAQLTGIPTHEISACEDNSSKADAYQVHALLKLYKIDLAHIDLNPVQSVERSQDLKGNLELTCIKKRIKLENKHFPDGMYPKDIKLMDDVQDLLQQAYQVGAGSPEDSQTWFNQAAFGYAILAAERVGLSENDIHRLVRVMNSQFDMKTLEEALEHYRRSPY